MGDRLVLQTILEEALGSENVYFQPPWNVQILYPCIVYARDNTISKFADNKSYCYTKRYQVTVIEKDPDGLVSDIIARLPLCSYLRFFTADNLNHDVFDLYF